jgi:Fic family protein
MNAKDFTTNAAGVARKTLNGYWAFVPHPLPPSIHYDPALTLLLSQADAALSELSGLGRFLPNPDLLIAPYIKREAVASSRIEGTQANISDLLIDEIEPKRTPPGSDVLEVRNYVSALNRGIQRLHALPLAGRLVREIHQVLMTGVRGQERTPGEFRRSQNWIGPAGCTLSNATYVPPPPDPEMHDCFKQWEIFANQRGEMPELVQCALLHEHFEAIHPFLDGNGRVGRLLITLFLIQCGRLSKPLLYLSSYFEQHKRDYYTLLQRIRTHGDWDSWLRFFLIAVRETARAAIDQSQSILNLRERFRTKIGTQHRALTLLDSLFVNPYTTVARASHDLGVTAPTATKTIAILENLGMLQELTRTKYRRFWQARPILAAVDPSTTAKPRGRRETNP